MFPNEENYVYFLKKMGTYLTDFMDIYAYCLLPNHFHLMARMKSEKRILEAFAKVITEKGTTSSRFEAYNINAEVSSIFQTNITNNSLKIVSYIGLKNPSSKPLTANEIISEQFRNLFSGYTKAINKQDNRRGSLFQKQFKRLPVE
jgi:hypothetical protein